MLTAPKRNLVVRVNYEKCTVALRNQRLVQLASSRIGETTSQVYAELLRLLEESVPRCRLDPTIDDFDDLPAGPTVTTTELNLAVSKSIKVWRGIGNPTHQADLRRPVKSLKDKKASADEVEVEGEVSSDEDESDEDVEMNGHENIPEVDDDSAGDGDDPFVDEEPRPAKRAKVTFQDKLPKPKSKPDTSEDHEMRLFHIKRHLQLLAEDSCKFIRKCGSGGSKEWTVDFEPLVEHLQELEMDTILLENFGPSGHRLVRMLRKLGKLEEKALPNLALMKQKDIRTKMAEMQMAGMVDIQEVPRDASRTTARTIFLWYFDPERVSSILLDNVYKAMSRCIQRLEIEKRRASGILAIAERTDVREADEQEVLDETQLRLLVDIRAKEEKLVGQIGRLDELVGVFRDY
jgi:DNA-directed RNA polymerase III subunit RPC3